MKFIFSQIQKSDILAIYQWKYPGEYAVYNLDGPLTDVLRDMLDARSPYLAVRDQSSVLIGSFCFGTSAQVWSSLEPHLFDTDHTITVGLAMRPDLTGQGLGQAFVEAGLDFARQQYQPTGFSLFVLPFNQRAIRVYERVGFRAVGTYVQPGLSGSREFLEYRLDF